MMYRSQIRPLKSLPLRSRPIAPHALAWSCDAELAVATDDTVSIFIPEYPKPGGDSDDQHGVKDVSRDQFTLSLTATGMFAPLHAMNAQLCGFKGIRLPPKEALGAEEEIKNRTIPPASRQVTGWGASISQIVKVEWSPSGLGLNLRPVLMVMTTNGELLTLGEHSDTHATTSFGLLTRNTKQWKVLWGLGAGMPIPAEDEEGAYRTMDERIKSFSWAKEISPGRALLAYETDEEEVVIMSIQYFERREGPEGSSEGFVWQVGEVARFDARGPHTDVDPLDPDLVPNGTAFSLRWSPWVSHGGARTASLAVISQNYVGFRQIVLQSDWTKGQDPKVKVQDSDTSGICLSLSTDSFVEWEDKVWDEGNAKTARGVICSPYEVTPFQVDILAAPSAPISEHSTEGCSTTYPKHSSTNPITGLIVHSPDPSKQAPVPLYSAVRASVTSTNHDWFETNLPQSTYSTPSWVQKLRQSTQRLVPREEAPEGHDVTDSEDTDDEFQDDEGTTPKIHPYRFRFWGMAASPGGGVTIAIMSKYSTQFPSRRGLSRVIFSARSIDQQDVVEVRAPTSFGLTTEGNMWEWMYGGGDQVPGATAPPMDVAMHTDTSLRELFKGVKEKQQCAFCDEELQNDGTEAKCPRNHSFAVCSVSGLAILAPGISQVCAVCQRKCLKDWELRKLAAEHIGSEDVLPTSGEQCGSCGGKFVA